MTVSNTTSKIESDANGVTIAFPFAFRIFAAANLVVSTIDLTTGAIAIKTLTTDYTVTGSGVNFADGGTVTFLVAPASGLRVRIQRVLVATQNVDLTNQGAFYPEIHEDEFDYLTMLIQQGLAGIANCLPLDASGLYWNAGALRITNLSDGLNAHDAATVGQIEALFAGGSASTAPYWIYRGDGSQVSFSILGSGLSQASSYHVSVDGVEQPPVDPEGDILYTVNVATSALTFTTAPPDQTVVLIRALGIAEILSSGSLDASAIVSGVFAPGRLGTGTANAAKFLRGDLTWNDTLLGPLSISGAFTGASLTVSGAIAGQIDGSYIVTGQVAPLRLGTGVPTTATFLRGDGAWSVPPGGSGGALPPGGHSYQFLRGDGVWSNVLPGNLVVDGIVVNTFFSTVDILASGLIQANTFVGFLDGSNISGSSSVPTVALGSGAAGANTLLHGNQTWSKVAVADISATGTPSAATVLFGDGTWASVGTAGLGTAVDDPFGVGFPTTADKTGFYRGDGKFTYALQGGLLAVGSTGLGQYLSVVQGANRGFLYSSNTALTTFYPITFDRSAVDVSGSSGTRFTDSDAPDVLGAYGRLRALRLRSNGSPYRKMTVNASASGAIAVDTNVAQYFKLTIVGNSTLTLSDGGTDPSASAELFATPVDIELIDVGASTITWASAVGSITWPGGGSAPSLAATGSNLLRFTRRQGVTGFLGYLVNSQAGGSYTDEQAQDAVGSILLDTATIDLTYVDATPTISASVKALSITSSEIAAGAVTSTKIGAGAVTSSAMAAASVTSGAIAAGSVGSAALAAASVGIANLTAGGAPGSTTFLRGDNVWAIPPTGGGGGGGISGINLYENGIPKQALATELNFVGCTVTPIFGSSKPTITVTAGTGTGLPSFAGASLMLVTNSSNNAATWTSAPAGPFTWGGLNIWSSTAGTSSNVTTLNLAQASSSVPAVHVERTITPASASDAASISVYTKRVGGNGISNYQNFYSVMTPHTTGFDIAETVIHQARDIRGGVSDAIWFNTWGPARWFQSTPDAQGKLHNFTTGIIRIGEVNYGNAWQDFGLVETRGVGSFVAGFEFFPDWLAGDCGGSGGGPLGVPHKYHASWAIGIGAAGAGDDGVVPKNWTGILIDTDGIVPTGYGMHLRGGSSSGLAGGKGIKFNDHWTTCIDTSAATVDGANAPAITLATNQRIQFGAGCYLWFDGTNLKCSTPGGGTHTIF